MFIASTFDVISLSFYSTSVKITDISLLSIRLELLAFDWDIRGGLLEERLQGRAFQLLIGNSDVTRLCFNIFILTFCLPALRF